jgi:hypothetical protein
LSPLTKFAYSLLNLYQHYQWKRPKLIWFNLRLIKNQLTTTK